MVNRGSPEDPLDSAELTAKFTANALGAAGPGADGRDTVAALAREVWSVGAAEDLTGLTRALSAVVTRSTTHHYDPNPPV
jgi:hypothetical protein